MWLSAKWKILDFDARVAFPLIIVIWSFRTSTIRALHLIGTVLEWKVAEHLEDFSLKFLASARDVPLLKSQFSDGGVGLAEEVCCWMDEGPPAVEQNGDDSAKLV